MTTIINTPSPGVSADDSGVGIGMIIGVLFVGLVIILFFAYGWPTLRSGSAPENTQAPNNTNITVTTPAPLSIPAPTNP